MTTEPKDNIEQQLQDKEVSALYQALPDDPVPAHLDDAILAAAKQQADGFNDTKVLATEGRFNRRNARLKYMASIAASFFVGVVSVQLYLQTEEISETAQSLPFPVQPSTSQKTAPSQVDGFTAELLEDDEEFKYSIDGGASIGEATSMVPEPKLEKAKPKLKPKEKPMAPAPASSGIAYEADTALTATFDAASELTMSMPVPAEEIPVRKKSLAEGDNKAEQKVRSTSRMFEREEEAVLEATQVAEAEAPSRDLAIIYSLQEKITQAEQAALAKDQAVVSSVSSFSSAAPAKLISTVPEYQKSKAKWRDHILMLVQQGDLKNAEQELKRYREIHHEFPEFSR